jgi:hypothetical protein
LDITACAVSSAGHRGRDEGGLAWHCIGIGVGIGMAQCGSAARRSIGSALKRHCRRLLGTASIPPRVLSRSQL